MGDKLISLNAAIAVIKEECWKDREMKLSDRIENALSAIPTTQVGATVSTAALERIHHDLQFIVDTIIKDKNDVAEQYPRLFAKIQQRRAESGNLGAVQVFGEIARDLLTLLPASAAPAMDVLAGDYEVLPVGPE